MGVNPQVTIDECMQHVTDKHCLNLPVVEDEKIAAMLSLGNVVNGITTAQACTIRHFEDSMTDNYQSS